MQILSVGTVDSVHKFIHEFLTDLLVLISSQRKSSSLNSLPITDSKERERETKMKLNFINFYPSMTCFMQCNIQ